MALLGRTVRFFLRYKVPSLVDSCAITLDEHTRIGRGSKRDCHRYPDRADLCIKVARRPHRPVAQQASLVEWHCALSLDRRGVPYTHRARCFGWVATNCGPGLVVERIRDIQGQAAPGLADWVIATQPTREQIDDLFTELRRWVLKHGVPVTDLNLGNLAVRHHEARPALVLVDGVGGQKIKIKFILYRRLKWFASAMSAHRWPGLQRAALGELAQLSSPSEPAAITDSAGGQRSYPRTA